MARRWRRAVNLIHEFQAAERSRQLNVLPRKFRACIERAGIFEIPRKMRLRNEFDRCLRREESRRAQTSSPKYVARRPPDTLICWLESCTDCRSTSKRVPHGSVSGFSRRMPRQRMGMPESIVFRFDSVRGEIRRTSMLFEFLTQENRALSIRRARPRMDAMHRCFHTQRGSDQEQCRGRTLQRRAPKRGAMRRS